MVDFLTLFSDELTRLSIPCSLGFRLLFKLRFSILFFKLMICVVLIRIENDHFIIFSLSMLLFGSRVNDH